MQPETVNQGKVCQILRGGGEHLINCRWYGLRLSPWECVERQLFFCDFHLWGCQECKEGVGLARRGKKFYCEKQEIETDAASCLFAVNLAQAADWPEGMRWLEECRKCKGGEITPDVGCKEMGAIQEISSRKAAESLKIVKSTRPRLPGWLKDATPAVRRAYLEEGK